MARIVAIPITMTAMTPIAAQAVAELYQAADSTCIEVF